MNVLIASLLAHIHMSQKVMEFERTQHYGLAFREVTHQLGFLMGMRLLLADLADYTSVYMVTFLLIGCVNGKIRQINLNWHCRLGA